MPDSFFFNKNEENKDEKRQKYRKSENYERLKQFVSE
jgi:hypothetical protein